MPLSSAVLASVVGQGEAHLCDEGEATSLGARLHREAAAPFVALRDAALDAGFALHPLSGFRSFDRQLSIWNRKVRGELAVLDSEGRPLDHAMLDGRALVRAILRWSALPGASRHHWGSDVDVYDAASTPDGYEVQLLPAEVEAGGMHAPLHEWLDVRIATGTAFGFYRPYDRDRGGVAPERWHLSYAPIAADYARVLTPTLLQDTIAGADMLLKDVVLEQLDEIYERFVINVSLPPNQTVA
ncbi:MAG: M15 family metallopeptidase [Gemmatimonadetes bacterium]|nr:M15 family metallopeptidase [Gemmatimonadota bacterium]